MKKTVQSDQPPLLLAGTFTGVGRSLGTVIE